MTFAYFDTSALIKRYVREPGSAHVASLLRRHDLLSSAITPVEIMSALGRRRRDRDLSDEAFIATVNRMRSERVHWELIEVGETVLSRAEEIVQGSVPMRSLDAVHIASLMAFQTASGIRTSFVTGDGRQRDAATSLGLDTIWIG
jgi:predicted nucleic acid-binding protein